MIEVQYSRSIWPNEVRGLISAYDKTYTYQMKHRLPQEVVTAIQPLLPKDAAITHFNNTLIIKSDSKDFQEIKKLLHQLDKPAQQFLISIRRNSQLTQKDQSANISGVIRRGDTNLRIGDRRHPSDIQIESHNAQIGYQLHNRQHQGDGVQQVRATEGYPAFISTGQAVPIRDIWINGNIIQSSTHYQPINQGFYVTIYLTGSQKASLNIETQNDQLSRREAGSIETASTGTRLQVPLGQWVNFGGTDSRDNTKGSRISSWSYSTRNKEMQLQIKVDPVTE